MVGGLGLKALFKKGARSLGVERGRDGTGGDLASAIGRVIAHLKDIGKAGARDSAAGVSVLLLLCNGAVRVETDGVVILVVGAGSRYGRQPSQPLAQGVGVDPGVEPKELVRMALHGTRVGGDVGGVLVVDDAQLGRVAGVDSCRVGGNRGGACVHHDDVCVACGVFMERGGFYMSQFVLFHSCCSSWLVCGN